MPAFDTPDPITADIDIFTGRIRIHASDRADTVVEVRPGDPSAEASVQAAERTEVGFTGGRLLVRGPRSKGLVSLLNWRGSIEVTVELPAGSRIGARGAADVLATGRLGEAVVHSSNGDIRLEETGRVDLKADNGDISVTRAAGSADVGAANGAVRIGAVEGTGTVTSSNGDISVGEATGDLRLNAATGDITVGRALADITAKSAYGRVRVGEVVRGAARLETGYGKARIGIAAGTATWLDLHSKHGLVRHDLAAGQTPDKSEATVEVHAHTNYGDIEVHRS
ncbi:DUF4097 family beta strand repeat-containing protein [Actinomadura rubrisoli]|uniref:DUF4097 domain-containing protein n=1 Tax=Actinomadura rubrisoli TaxID=2530368 RepID=A0A4V2YY15_9ACTN|nr:DUF4097 family beta strand repeat-containing protein [Actinomadura rubrisoli]TDD91467.1 hypothetical protein E1298_11785 [Actinomadura rubrisoli]